MSEASAPQKAQQPPVNRRQPERDQAEPVKSAAPGSLGRAPRRIATGGTSRVTNSALVAPHDRSAEIEHVCEGAANQSSAVIAASALSGEGMGPRTVDDQRDRQHDQGEAVSWPVVTER